MFGLNQGNLVVASEAPHVATQSHFWCLQWETERFGGWDSPKRVEGGFFCGGNWRDGFENVGKGMERGNSRMLWFFSMRIYFLWFAKCFSQTNTSKKKKHYILKDIESRISGVSCYGVFPFCRFDLQLHPCPSKVKVPFSWTGETWRSMHWPKLSWNHSRLLTSKSPTQPHRSVRSLKECSTSSLKIIETPTTDC